MFSKALWAAAFALVAFPAAADTTQGTGAITGSVTAMPPKFLPETVVYLKNVPGSYEPRTQVMDQQRMAFIPHVLPVTVRDTVRFENHDPMVHDVFSPDNEKYSLGSMSAGDTRTYTFTKDGLVYSQLCHFHPEMLAYVFVGQNPYMAVPDAKGAYTIAGVPPGTYQLAVWNKKLKTGEQTVTVTRDGSVTVNLTIHR